jgi:hypothetical protein
VSRIFFAYTLAFATHTTAGLTLAIGGLYFKMKSCLYISKGAAMLSEFKDVSQHPGEPRRRYFLSEYFDLYVWLDKDSEFVGFQLCYDKNNNERALSYIDGAFSHRGIDSGESVASENRTPILVADGVFDRNENLDRFIQESKMIDPKVAEYVIKMLKNYNASSAHRSTGHLV